MVPPIVPIIKQILRGLDSEEMKVLAERALQLESPAEIQDFVREQIPFINQLIG